MVGEFEPRSQVPNTINPFPNKPFCDRSEFKEVADDNWNVAVKVF